VRTGQDAVFPKPFEWALPTQRTVEDSKRVPGAIVPASNALAVSQFLSWLAKERRDVQEQLDRTRSIPEFMAALLKKGNKKETS
jgi:hypothetical protein